MSKRFSETDKWDDVWFRQLLPASKLTFLFMCDRCDMAGFYELDMEDIAFRTKMPEADILGAIEGLNRGLIRKGDVIWLRNFLRHQKNLPLNPDNNAHKHIIYRISLRVLEFPEIPSLIGADKGLFSPIGKGRGKGKGNDKGKGRGGGEGEGEGNTPEMVRIGSWFGRRPTTRWSDKEEKAYKALQPIPPDDLDEMHEFYTRDLTGCKDFRRHDLQTLLNNWNGELDRSRNFKLEPLVPEPRKRYDF